MSIWKRRSWLVLALFLKTATGHAHPSPHSAIELDVQGSEVRAELKIPLEQLGLALGHPLSDSPRASVLRFQKELRDYVARHLNARSGDSRPWQLVIDGDLGVTEDEVPVDLVVRARWLPPAGVSTRDFSLESDLVLHWIVSHKIFVVLRGDSQRGGAFKEPKVLGVLRYLHNSTEIHLDESEGWKSFAGTFRLGMKHIAEGTDHLLFLLMLLLPAPLIATSRRWDGFVGSKTAGFRLLKVVTAFTLGHSLTLAIGALGWLRLPSALVEGTIAASVFVSAVHALRPIFPRREFWVAAGFGLVHGLAFSAAIADLGLHSAQLALNVLGFNLGIEAMQLGIVCLVAPALLVLAPGQAYRWLRPVGAVFGGLAALGWLSQRALGLNNPMDLAVNWAVAHAAVLFVLISGAALGQSLRQFLVLGRDRARVGVALRGSRQGRDRRGEGLLGQSLEKGGYRLASGRGRVPNDRLLCGSPADEVFRPSVR